MVGSTTGTTGTHRCLDRDKLLAWQQKVALIRFVKLLALYSTVTVCVLFKCDHVQSAILVWTLFFRLQKPLEKSVCIFACHRNSHVFFIWQLFVTLLHTHWLSHGYHLPSPHALCFHAAPREKVRVWKRSVETIWTSSECSHCFVVSAFTSVQQWLNNMEDSGGSSLTTK